MNVKGRLIKLEDSLRSAGEPPGCAWTGTHCATYDVICAKPGQAAEPIPLADSCPRCGRPRLERLYILDMDPGEPPPLPEVGAAATTEATA